MLAQGNAIAQLNCGGSYLGARTSCICAPRGVASDAELGMCWLPLLGICMHRVHTLFAGDDSCTAQCVSLAAGPSAVQPHNDSAASAGVLPHDVF